MTETSVISMKHWEKGALCDTCRRYPRHVEEFEGVREYSLTLSCPEAARRMLTDSAPMTLVEWETEEEETFEEGFDFLLYTQLADARKVVFRILQDRDVDMRIRMEACLIFAETMQELLDRENYAGVDDWIRIHEADYRRDMELAKVRWEEKEEKRLLQRKKEVEQLKSLEILDPAWAALLEEAESVLCQNGDASYRSLCAEFQETPAAMKAGRPKTGRLPRNRLLFFSFIHISAEPFMTVRCMPKYGSWNFPSNGFRNLPWFSGIKKEKNRKREPSSPWHIDLPGRLNIPIPTGSHWKSGSKSIRRRFHE